jgi:para-nitrobenzyl esterase
MVGKEVIMMKYSDIASRYSVRVLSIVTVWVAICSIWLDIAAAAVVQTEQGALHGLEAHGIEKFLGIPYAAPPIGPLRWMPPQPHVKWSGVFNATEFGSHCAQTARVVGTPSSSEDCLFLNVYSPIGTSRKLVTDSTQAQNGNEARGRAVMVWLHGGAFTAGESDDFDASDLADVGDVIVVTINYRLGVLGFLAHPALTAESPDHASGNYGILDQQLALNWVQQNIGAFGGDPGNVTIFGQSAGGLSVLANMASPGARGLFHRAIIQSGAYELLLPSLITGEAQGTEFASNVECIDQTAQCLRSLTVETLLANQISVSPVVDGFVLPLSLQTAAATGQFSRIPVINGSNHDEARFMYAMNELAGQTVSSAEYPATVIRGFGPQAGPLILAQYPVTAYVDADEALASIETDSTFACTARLADQALSAYVPVFAYEFNDEHAPEIFLPPVSYPYGAAHESELQYLFAAEDLSHLSGRVPQFHLGQPSLSKAMMRYWVQFAKSGNPNGPQTPNWARYAVGADEFQALAPFAIAAESTFASTHHCEFWAELFPQ